MQEEWQKKKIVKKWFISCSTFFLFFFFWAEQNGIRICRKSFPSINCARCSLGKCNFNRNMVCRLLLSCHRVYFRCLFIKKCTRLFTNMKNSYQKKRRSKQKNSTNQRENLLQFFSVFLYTCIFRMCNGKIL